MNYDIAVTKYIPHVIYVSFDHISVQTNTYSDEYVLLLILLVNRYKRSSIQSEAINFLFQVYPGVMSPYGVCIGPKRCLRPYNPYGIANKMYNFIQTIKWEACKTKYKTNDYHQW